MMEGKMPMVFRAVPSMRLREETSLITLQVTNALAIKLWKFCTLNSRLPFLYWEPVCICSALMLRASTRLDVQQYSCYSGSLNIFMMSVKLYWLLINRLDSRSTWWLRSWPLLSASNCPSIFNAPFIDPSWSSRMLVISSGLWLKCLARIWDKEDSAALFQGLPPLSQEIQSQHI